MEIKKKTINGEIKVSFYDAATKNYSQLIAI